MDIYEDLRGHKSENDSTMAQTISGGWNITGAFARCVRCATTQWKIGMFVGLSFLGSCSAKNTHNYLLKMCYLVLAKAA